MFPKFCGNGYVTFFQKTLVIMNYAAQNPSLLLRPSYDSLNTQLVDSFHSGKHVTSPS